VNQTLETSRRAVLWRDAAACAGTDPERFFSADPVETAEALRLCATCPVQAACRTHAESTPEYAGVWGGIDLDERRRAARRRPRKDARVR
jgi:WhiB family redox-sensing transcriptional regulator